MSFAGSVRTPVDRRQSTASENFRPFSASLSPPEETYLQKPKQSLFSKSNNVATAISPSGWVATASTKYVHLYNVKEANKSQTIVLRATLVVNMISKREEIRAVAISEDLLAVVTRSRLLVYDGYKTSNNSLISLVEEGKHIDSNGKWTPKSVSIAQTGTAATGLGATACILVGGEGSNGVKMYRYAYMSGWNTSNDRATLECPGNSGAVKAVGFSPFRRKSVYGQMAFALTAGNRLYCWELYLSPSRGLQTISPIWRFDCNPAINQQVYQDEISSAALIMSPTGRPYFLCTVDHKQGSHIPLTFIVPMNILDGNSRLRHECVEQIPDTILGKNVLAGTASPNGHFLVILEKGRKRNLLKVLTLRGAPSGGLTSTTSPLEWEVKLEGLNSDTSILSISIEETQGGLQIIAIDGCGHVATARISVPGMLVLEDIQSHKIPTALELAYDVPTIQELAS